LGIDDAIQRYVFYGVCVFLIKFEVIYAWMETSPPDIIFLISQELPIGIWAGFFPSGGMICLHNMSLFPSNLGEIWMWNA
jgi:hypothetical protein